MKKAFISATAIFLCLILVGCTNTAGVKEELVGRWGMITVTGVKTPSTGFEFNEDGTAHAYILGSVAQSGTYAIGSNSITITWDSGGKGTFAYKIEDGVFKLRVGDSPDVWNLYKLD